MTARACLLAAAVSVACVWQAVDAEVFTDHWTSSSPSVWHSIVKRQSGRRRGGSSSNVCDAQCSYHFTLPCSFPALDPCLLEYCQAKCDTLGKIVNACYCRTVLEDAEPNAIDDRKSVTYRACFCQPSQKDIDKAKAEALTAA